METVDSIVIAVIKVAGAILLLWFMYVAGVFTWNTFKD